MPWLRLEDNFPEHDKIAELHDRSFRLHVVALCYCARNLTDGQINPRSLKVILAVLGASGGRWIKELIAANLWVDRGDGHYEIKDYLQYNPDADKIKKRRDELTAKRSEAGRRGAEARWKDGKPDGKTDGNLPLAKGVANEMANRNGPSPAHPNPKKFKGSTAEMDFEVEKIAKLRGADGESPGVIASYAAQLDFPTVARIRSAAQEKRAGIGWAINALKDEINERRVA